MGSAKHAVKARLEERLKQAAPARLTEEDWAAIQAEFSEVTAGYLRRLVRDSGIPLAPLVEGVRQKSFGELERTLLELESEYSAARSAQNRTRMQECRHLVIEARKRALWAARRATDPDARAEKEEMAQWMLIWLEDPPAFPPWAALRKRALGEPDQAG